VPRFDDLEISDDFEAHQAAAGRPVITDAEALQVWDKGFTVRRNPHGHLDTRLLIGLTDGGRQVTLVAREIRPGLWFTYTAWKTKPSDLA
jgi:hypothetical protein